MKTMYRVNVIFLLINALLFLIPMLGMVFMMPLGLLQVVCSIWLLTQYKRTSSSVQWLTVTHLVITFIVLCTMFFLGNDNHNFTSNTVQSVFIVGMIISAILALFFLFISYKSHTENQEKLNNQ